MDHPAQSDNIILRGRRMKFKALELIGFQKDDFGARLELLMTALQTKIRDNVYPAGEKLSQTEEVQAIQRITMERIGLKVEIETNLYLAAIIPFYPNKHHIFLADFWKGNISLKDQDRILNRKDVQQGSVNMEKAYLSGFFSDYTNEVFMNFRDLVLDFKLTPPELTAVYLHEIGHGFDACAFSDRLESNNQVIAEVFRHITQRNDKTDMQYVFKELRKVNEEVTEKEVDDLVNGTKVVAGYTWFKVVIGGVQSQQGEKTYDKTSFEAASDSFANRFGYGKAIITGLEKLHANARFFKDPKTGSAMSYFGNVMATLYVLAVICALIGVGQLLIACYCALFLGACLRLSGSDFKDYTYDDLKIRYTRIRQDMIEFLKRSETDDKKMKDIIVSIREVDSIIEAIGHDRTPFNDIADVIFSGSRNAARAVKEQQMLENLMFNNLFLVSSELKVANK